MSNKTLLLCIWLAGTAGVLTAHVILRVIGP